MTTRNEIMKKARWSGLKIVVKSPTALEKALGELLKIQLNEYIAKQTVAEIIETTTYSMQPSIGSSSPSPSPLEAPGNWSVCIDTNSIMCSQPTTQISMLIPSPEQTSLRRKIRLSGLVTCFNFVNAGPSFQLDSPMPVQQK